MGVTSSAHPPPSNPSSTGTTSVKYAQAWKKLRVAYLQKTPAYIKALDAYMLFCMLTGIAQFLYCILGSSYPYNAFIGGFASSVGSFVLAANVRLETAASLSQDRAAPARLIAEFVMGHVILHMIVANYIG